MDCKRDEALRAVEKAESMFVANNFDGAKKYALMAKKLYPGLEGLPEMLATIDVHLLAAENTRYGKANWYWILGVDPLVNDETLRKQYKKLAQLLHPDKNNSVGADGAWKLLSEAWNVLSDKKKRLAYDHQRHTKFGRLVDPCSSSSGTSSVEDHPAESTASNSGSQPSTFWTGCNHCKAMYEYRREYLNQQLLCPSCHEPFVAVETAPPPSSLPWS